MAKDKRKAELNDHTESQQHPYLSGHDQNKMELDLAPSRPSCSGTYADLNSPINSRCLPRLLLIMLNTIILYLGFSHMDLNSPINSCCLPQLLLTWLKSIILLTPMVPYYLFEYTQWVRPWSWSALQSQPQPGPCSCRFSHAQLSVISPMCRTSALIILMCWRCDPVSPEPLART
jgi:hypothetical protein